ncbi:heme ABC exporter ATP-binding protein CcmA [Chthonobacter rhizosphaerae]|uniref:heme ABC exporter ATP-binding protein CcmA n=1 Tax=Chthonobacter rhizosphaerae TaxID=2735553 RepID=UPI0015EEDDAF|nr:heme ABC exporter ATP-binding protein CcmA [Chthonobacter rhizosphaerae]
MADGCPPNLQVTGRASPLLPLVVRELALRRGDQPVLASVTFTLQGGGVTVLLGPNGAGKSVLLKALDGLILPDAGTVTWAGRAPDDVVRRRIGFVFQDPVLLRRSVLANLTYVSDLRRLPRSAAETALAGVGLTALAHRPARVLSGGERQRLALARALVDRPDVLLLDEPTASLDPASVGAIEAVIRREAASGTAVVLVTHDVAQARRLADRVVFLHAGRVTEETPAERFFAGPASEAARAYLAGRLLI